MSEAIGSILSLAVAAAISPFPIIGVVLMLTTPRARVNGPLFIVGWLVGLGVVGAIGLTLAGAAAGDDGETAPSSRSSGSSWVWHSSYWRSSNGANDLHPASRRRCPRG